MALTILLTALFCVSFIDAAFPNQPLSRHLARQSPQLPNLTTTYYFDQIIDHNDPSLGTFQQRYWVNSEFYEYGGPIVLLTPPPANAEGSVIGLTNASIAGMIAQQQHGATVLVEHRFFGFSNPRDNLTSESLELLTVQQTIDDLAYFAQNVNLPIPGGDEVKPDTTPWVAVGGGYAGSLVSWTMVNKPGIFRAGYASSALVQLVTDYYDYFTIINEYMPQNCSSDVQAVIGYLDKIHAENNTTAMQSLKESFGLGNLSHIEDFANALRFNLLEWQKLTPDDGPGAMFFKFCDALEVDGISGPATGWGLEHAIDAWGSFWKNTYYQDVCNGTDAETCFGSYNTSDPSWTNATVDNPSRSWSWLTCNQLGSYQVGPPDGQPTIVSRILLPTHFERLCLNTFPDKFFSPPSPSTAELNSAYGGWNLNVDRLFFANGLRDPWRSLTVSADGLNKANTTTQPIYESDGFVASDMAAENGADETVLAVQMAALEYMKEWLA